MMLTAPRLCDEKEVCDETFFDVWIRSQNGGWGETGVTGRYWPVGSIKQESYINQGPKPINSVKSFWIQSRLRRNVRRISYWVRNPTRRSLSDVFFLSAASPSHSFSFSSASVSSLIPSFPSIIASVLQSGNHHLSGSWKHDQSLMTREN
jgi:hypothetical protein